MATKKLLTEQELLAMPEKDYMNDRLRSAVWIIRSLEERQRTLYQVMESIVKHQRDFFEHGIYGLKPLVLKDIAEDIGRSESSISRITTNKYVGTPHGIFELLGGVMEGTWNLFR